MLLVKEGKFMSVESARFFVDRMFKDSAFRESIRSVPTKEGRLKAAQEAGYDFSVEDAEKMLPAGITMDQLQAYDPSSDEVPDEILEAVSGGKGASVDDWWAQILIGVGVEAVAAAIVI
jgi:predicted ribosomally synthesized peptide with nif11-like leader